MSRRRRTRRGGFTLLEVVIAMAILVMALAALAGHEGIAIQMSDYSNRLSQAMLLAQGKMLDLEHRLIEDESTMDDLDGCDEGDFGDDGFREFRWKACGYKLEVPEGATEAITERFMTVFSGLVPGAGAGAVPGAGAGNDPASALIANQISMAVGAIPMFLEQLEDKIRKVRLEVTWKDVVGERTVVLERFITTLGQDRRGGPPPPGAEGDEPPIPPLGVP